MPVFFPQFPPDAASVLMSLRSISTETRRLPAVVGGRGGSGTTGWTYYNTTAHRPLSPQTGHGSLADLLQLRERQRIADVIIRTKALVEQDFITYATELRGIDHAAVEVALLVLVGLAAGFLGGERIQASLTPERSLHVRAVLPAGVGTVHVSVLLYAGVQPHVLTGVADVDDNTLVSVFGADGELRPDLGADAPLAAALETTIRQLLPLVRRQREQALGLR